MSLETATKISQLVPTNPAGSDPKSQGDDHLRMLKTVLQNNAIKSEIGQSATADHNFSLDASADDGTMKLARGNAGATTQDIMTVAANGGVSIKGGTVAPAAGMVGETIQFTNVPTSVSDGSFNGIGGANLTPGIWLLTGAMTYSITTGPCQMRSAGFSTSNSGFTGPSVLEQYSTNGGYGGSVALIPLIVVVGAGGLGVYVTGRASFTGGSITMGSVATATRVA